MGNELDNPILIKNSLDKETPFIKLGLSSVQGWKTYMGEYNFFLTDIFPDTEKKIDLFGLFSGEGGPEVAKYICNILPDKIKANNNFKEGKYPEALKETFIEVDNSLNSEIGKNELKKIEEEFKLNEKEEIDLINKTCGNGDCLPERELEQIKCIKDLLNPRNLTDYNISFFSGCSGLVLIITNDKIYVASIGNIRCIPIDGYLEVMSDKVNKINIISDESEKNRISISQNFKEKQFYPEFLDISRGFGFYEYKENKWLKPEDQAVCCEPEIIEINYDQCKYLIISSNGMFEQGDNNDNIFYNKCNRNLAEYFIEKINKDNNRKMSRIIEEYFDRIIPKKKNNNIDIQYQNYMSNISCAIIQLFTRPKIQEKKVEDIKNDNNNANNPNEKQKMDSFKKGNTNNKSMKNIFSFLKNSKDSTSTNNTHKGLANSKFQKTEKKEKKLESSSSFTNIFKKRQGK